MESPLESTAAGDGVQQGTERQGLPRQDTDPFAFLGQSDRTNSFPDVPPRHDHLPPIPPSSQAEDILGRTDRDQAIADKLGKGAEPDFSNLISLHDGDRYSGVGSTEEQDTIEHMDDIYEIEGAEVSTPPDAEARFEEGLRLVSRAHAPAETDALPEEANTHPEDLLGQILGTQDGPDTEGLAEGPGSSDLKFDAQHPPSTGAPSQDPQQLLERKSTLQVLDNLRYPPHHDLHPDQTLQGAIIPGPSKVVEGNLEPSTLEPNHETSLEDRVVGDEPVELDWMDQAVDATDNTDLQHALAGGQDQDLSAMWQAALADEDFLEDSNEVADVNVDPSDFLGTEHHKFQGEESSGMLDDRGTRSETWADSRSNRTQNDQMNSSYNPASAAQAHQPTSLQSQPSSGAYYAPGMSGYGQGLMPSTISQFQQPPAPRPAFNTAQSFADKSKGGYASPYDLPVDVSRPRKKASMQQMALGSSVPKPPPPRSTSINLVRESAAARLPSQAPHAQTISPPQASNPFPPQNEQDRQNREQSTASLKSKASTASFFEELPVNSKPRQASGGGRYTPQTNHPTPPPPGPPPRSMTQPNQLPLATSSQSLQQTHRASHDGLPQQQLVPPERINPYAVPPNEHPNATPPAVASARYSPAPQPRSATQSGVQYAPPPKNAYSPAPSAVAHQPRTSSPLALNETYTQNNVAGPTDTSAGPPRQALPRASGPRAPSARSGSYGGDGQYQPQTNGRDQQVDPLNWPDPSPNEFSGSQDERISGRAASPIARAPDQEQSVAPPRRSQTQSPSTAVGGARSLTISQEMQPRPASVHGPTSPTSAASAYASMTNGRASAHSRTFSQNIDYVTPTDGREADPLQRWKGYPIFSWGFGGTMVTTFPKDSPRYSSGSAFPIVKRSPGELKLKSLKTILPLEDHVTRFPGPLRAKSKKKEVDAWLSGRIAELEKDVQQMQYDGATSDVVTKAEEKIILWKCLRVFVESDGAPENNSNVGKLVRSFLAPNADDGGDPIQVRSPNSNDTGLHQDIVDPRSVEELRTALLRGERESAIWQAVDKRLWGHALLISSTLNRSIWKQVVQEFVRKEVKPLGNNTESLAALYEIFAGNWEESIDELVPPSARAGLQMVSKSSDPGQVRNALEGLDRWKETLSLILNNRSTDDGLAIASLGRLLLDYGRVEAAHTCFIFARFHSQFGGPDDPQSSMTLLSASHIQHSVESVRDLDSVLLSEVYEFALSLTGSSTISSAAPHMQGYKLYHAFVLAENGFRSESQAYCESIHSTIKSSTRPSPYYHPALIASLEDLAKRLHQSPKDGTSSWISKPSMEKVSGSFLAKFNSFVAGDDSDAASTGSGKDGNLEVGPFSRIAGGTPTISRSPSHTDLYAPYTGGESPMNGLPAAANIHPKPSRYAPATTSYTPRSSQEHSRLSHESGRPTSSSQRKSQELERPPESNLGNYRPNQYPSHPPGSSSLQNPYAPIAEQEQEPAFPAYPPSDQATPGSQPSSMAIDQSSGASYQPQQVSTYEPAPPSQTAPAPRSYVPTQSGPSPSPAMENGVYLTNDTYMALSQPGNEPYTPPYEPRTSTYEPSSKGSYSANATQNDKDPADEVKGKKKSFMDDDDDDFTAKAAAIINGKAQKDKEAEENFKKAAAADAARDEQSGERKGWFGGWFGGKKDPSAGPGPIKAKLGEQSSFYYDADMKQWVNKKGGPAQSTPAPRPPPPRGPAIRAVSGSAPPSALSTGRPTPPPSSSGAPTPSFGSSLAPPSLATTAPSSSASALGLDPSTAALPPSGPASGAGTPARTDSPASTGPERPLPTSAPSRPGPSGTSSGPPSRPPTSMSNDSSIDDLIGPPGGARRAGGTARRGKKGGRYVDVMAK